MLYIFIKRYNFVPNLKANYQYFFEIFKVLLLSPVFIKFGTILQDISMFFFHHHKHNFLLLIFYINQFNFEYFVLTVILFLVLYSNILANFEKNFVVEILKVIKLASPK